MSGPRLQCSAGILACSCPCNVGRTAPIVHRLSLSSRAPSMPNMSVICDLYLVELYLFVDKES